MFEDNKNEKSQFDENNNDNTDYIIPDAQGNDSLTKEEVEKNPSYNYNNTNGQNLENNNLNGQNPVYNQGYNNNQNFGYNNAYNNTQRVNANQGYNNNGNANPYNMYNSYNNNFDPNANEQYNVNLQYKDVKNTGSRKVAKVLGFVAGGVIIALTGGIIGGLITQRFTGTAEQGTSVAQSASYAAPEFVSSSDGSLTISQAFEKVKPAVVTISTKGITSSGYGDTSQAVEGIGSGFIINENGYILTNYHVISGSKEVTVLLSTGVEVSAKVVNYDQEKDIAVIKLADGTTVPGVAELGDSDALYPGEDVIAIGTPLSKEFAQTCTKGIISAVNRSVEASTGVSMNVIQTDTAINPGNSGGPLVNTKGQVIGINSMKLVEDTVEGIGFSIPINLAKERIDTLSKPILSLGVSIGEITAEKSKKNGYPVGLYVYGVQKDSVAETAGIKVGDIIIKFDGKDITTAASLNEAKGSKNAGDKVDIVVYRDGKEEKLQVTLSDGN